MVKQQKVKGFQELFIVVCIALLVTTAGIVKAETQASGQNSVSSTGTEPAAPNPYAGDIWHRSKLTGDWGGQRTKLAEEGITFDMASMQTYQGVAGGRRQLWKYGGLFEYTIKLDFQKMGLWPGAFLEIGAENQYGQFINRNTGAMIPANTAGVFPEPGQQEVYLDRVVFYFRGSSPPVKVGVRAVFSNGVAGQAKPETVSATPVKAWESTHKKALSRPKRKYPGRNQGYPVIERCSAISSHSTDGIRADAAAALSHLFPFLVSRQSMSQ